MKNIVINVQEENWQDDGGAHDPFAITVTEEDYQFLKSDGVKSDDEIEVILDRSPYVDLPAQIDDVFVVWTSWG
jgi:hypothetical protein